MIWTDVRDQLARAYPRLRDAGNERVELEVGGTTVRVAAHDGWLDVVGLVGDGRQVPPMYSLSFGADAAIGRICTIDGVLALRQMLLLDGLGAADLDETVAVLARNCELTRRSLAQG